MLELVALAIAPVIFLLLYIYQRDRYEPEPLRLVLWVFLLGGLSTIPAGILELPFPEGIISSAIAAPVIEEGIKFLIVYLAIFRRPEFNEPMDGIVYATAASLGFAMVENIFYVVEGGVAVGIVRALVSIPGHVIFSCIWGFALGIAKFRPERERAGIIAVGLLGGIFLHALFNFSVEVFDILGFLLLLFVVVPLGWLLTCRNIRCAHADPASACSTQAAAGASSASAAAAAPQPAQRFCTGCGEPLLPGKIYCSSCGKKL